MIDLLLAAAFPAKLCPLEAQTLKQAADRIEAHYVLEERAGAIARELREAAQDASSASACADPDAFARDVTKALRETSGDHHFYMERIKDEPQSDWISEWRASGASRGQGVGRVEILPGNIGYIQIRSFFELEPAFRNYRAAFDMVATTHALILDLRGNGGGAPETAWPLQWTFLEKGAPSPMAMQSRNDGVEPREEPSVLWARYGADRPLAILIDKRTFSAPEAVAFTLKTTGRATIIGEPSGGGAHLLDGGFDLNEGFRLHTPTVRPISTLNGSNWEATGVSPDIQVSSEAALDEAVRLLTTKLKQGGA